MVNSGTDPVVGFLNRLVTVPPPDLVDRVVARWTRVTGRLADLYVAFTDRGISFVRMVGTVGGDVERFLESYRDRYGQPLLPAERPLGGLQAAADTGQAASLPFDLSRTTDFERDVLEATRRIPVGETRPYAWVAREIGRPAAVRAVGSALGRNPVPVLIPCHRVTRSDGRPGDYLFGSAVKEALLRAEGAVVVGR